MATRALVSLCCGATLLAGCYESHVRDTVDAGVACDPDTPTLVYSGGGCVRMEVQGSDETGTCPDMPSLRGRPARAINLSTAGVRFQLGYAAVDACPAGERCGHEYWRRELDSCACSGGGVRSDGLPTPDDVAMETITRTGPAVWNVILGSARVRYLMQVCPTTDAGR